LHRNLIFSEFFRFTNFQDEYISLIDIAKYKNTPKDVIKNWLRSKDTIQFLGLWESLHNSEFKGVEFDSFNQLKTIEQANMTTIKHLDTAN